MPSSGGHGSRERTKRMNHNTQYRPHEPFALPLEEILIDSELYPRFELLDETAVDRYSECVAHLSPVVIADTYNARNVLIDGRHRLEAHKRAGLEQIQVLHLGALSVADATTEVILRNKHRYRGNAMSRILNSQVPTIYPRLEAHSGEPCPLCERTPTDVSSPPDLSAEERDRLRSQGVTGVDMSICAAMAALSDDDREPGY